MVGKGDDQREERDAPRREEWPRSPNDEEAPVEPRVPLREQSYDPAEVSGREQAIPSEDDLDFETDVEYLHRAIYREAFEPAEGREPTPWWVWAISALALFWGGLYLGRHGGTFNPAVHIAYQHVQGLVTREAAEQRSLALTDPIAAGEAIYRANCQVCHQVDGTGVSGAFPPLIGVDRVVGPPEGLILILLHGLIGPVEVLGEIYNGAMPAWAGLLDDAEIAAVATFIRQWEANDAPPVEPEVVTALREATTDRTTPWTEPELDEALARPEIQAATQGVPGAEDGAGARPGAEGEEPDREPES